LCGAKPPHKPGWTDAVSFGGSTIRYGDFTADARCWGSLGAPRPSPCEGCDGIIADVGGDFRVASIVVGVKMRPRLALAIADPCGVTSTRPRDQRRW
jgi:hypothetical protein